MHHPTPCRSRGQVVGRSGEEQEGFCGRYEIDRPSFDCDSARLRAAVADAALEEALKVERWDHAAFRLCQITLAITNWQEGELERLHRRFVRERPHKEWNDEDALDYVATRREYIKHPDWWTAVVALARSPHSTTPKALRGDQERMRQLGKLCELLQFVTGSSPFFLSVSVACEFLGWNPKTHRKLAHAKLKVLQNRKLLIEETKGKPGYGGRPETATRWLWAPAFNHTPTALSETEGGMTR